MSDNKSIKVSILCLCYNHEKYIKDCLDGFLKQKTNFNFEIIIHDDASTDSSASIIKEYEKKHPNIVKPIYQNENQYSQDVNIYEKFLISKVKGKYIAFCEGDDFWTDENKLQTMYDILEKFTDCNMCTHKTKSIDYSKNKSLNFYPNNMIDSGVILGETFMHMRCCQGQYFHISSYLVTKKSFIKYLKLREKYFNFSDYEDLPMQIFYGYYGKVYYINKEMSCYRYNLPNSWTDKHGKLTNINIENLNKSITSLKAFNKYTDNKYSDCITRQINVFEQKKCRYYYARDIKKHNLIINMRTFNKYSSLSWKERIKIILLIKFPLLYKFYYH